MIRKIHTPLVPILLTLGIISGCTATPPFTKTPTTSALPPLTDTPTLTSTPLPATPTETMALSQVCSPLGGFNFQELAGIVSQPFQRPRPGKDDDHQGVDFSFWTYKNYTTMQGLPIQAVLTGRVAAVINNRYPYGNMVIIESPISVLPAGWIERNPLPTREPVQSPDPALTCPAGEDGFDALSSNLSIYLLYAHMDQPAKFKIGDPVTCGQEISGVGTTGRSVNYHLHLEMRIGPSGATFPAMAHYWNDATAQEMHTFCMWRVSGIFQMLDPMLLFHASP